MSFGVYSVVQVNFAVTGSVFYEPPKPADVSAGSIQLNNGSTIERLINLPQPNQPVYLSDYITSKDNLIIQPNSAYTDSTHPQGQRSVLTLQMTSKLSSYARMFVNYNKSINSNVKVNASSLYLKGSNVYEIYIDNNSTSSVNLADLDISIQYDEQTSLIHKPNKSDSATDNDHLYVELGTLMRDSATKNEYIKWRLIGTQTSKGSGSRASQYEIFSRTSTMAPTSGVGVFILETNTQKDIKRTDTTNSDIGFNDVPYNNMYSGDYHSESGWTSIPADDYATSTLRRYINGVDIYKSHNARSQSSAESYDFSNMYTDFNIDIEHDVIYSKIKSAGGRTLTDLYAELYESETGTKINFPSVLNGDSREFYHSSHADMFWTLSYHEAIDLFLDNNNGHGTGVSNDRDWKAEDNDFYWLRNSYNRGYHSYFVCMVTKNGSFPMSNDFIDSCTNAARPVFTMTF